MIRKSVLLAGDPASAFALFTQRIGEWWPESHRPAKVPGSTIVLEASGRFAEVAPDGRVFPLGRVTVWDPPGRLVLDFYLGTDADHPTAVDVRFVAEASGTRVTIEHAPTPASLDLWETRATRYDRSWEVVLAALSATG